MRRGSPPIGAADCRSANCSATAPTARADHALQPGEMIRSIALPAPLAGERALYKRAISRSYAEWPLVEVCARAVVADGAFQFVRIAAGGIAPVPLRLTGVGSRAAGRGRRRRQPLPKPRSWRPSAPSRCR